jgi:hypothetical protein
VGPAVCGVICGALTFSLLAFDPSDYSTCTFRSMVTGSQKRLVHISLGPCNI